ncbi:MAG TPA: thiamine phosphate synthase [Pseudolabrys sp.]|nr:thiamine phosphate synthase [Pseudolabrys sp.]
MRSRPKAADPRPAPRLYLVTPQIVDAAAFAGALGDALGAADVAAVLLRLADADERTLINRVKAIAAVTQAKDVALIVDGHPDLVARAGADGAHLCGIESFSAALPTLKPDRIAGAGGLTTRHDAMLAAEAGADYVMFGEPETNGKRPSFAAIEERVAWWAEVFEPPCIGFAATFEEIAPIAAAGADFVALGDWLWAQKDVPNVLAHSANQLGLSETIG